MQQYKRSIYFVNVTILLANVSFSLAGV